MTEKSREDEAAVSCSIMRCNISPHMLVSNV